jgi:hypothetical protein
MQAVRDGDRDRLLLTLDEHAVKLQQRLGYLLTKNRTNGLPSAPDSLKTSRNATPGLQARS